MAQWRRTGRNPRGARPGAPAPIAAAEFDRLGAVPSGPRWFDWLTIPLLLFGGIIVPIFGWCVGVVLLWLSRVWSVREKLMATLVVPGGLLPAFYFLLS